ncbi:hypothetical protein H2201_008202 [Coniosporium apollinis]|uniref:DJ-1/PfpI domain-containing protein n=2 Tax=Coniosporium TaxID=2810619 RepID=A0ABQ9NGT4_9PEZI|nr:hypothetical protein H2199_002888 [Cladosporium sp. JES 115]KAJ9657406.1 hypothetical protein H2201_008202 [Coniosporium apollinis]
MADPPVNYGVILYPSFHALDVFGPLDILNLLALQRPLNLYLLSSSLEPVSTKPPATAKPPGSPDSNFGEAVVPSHTFSAPPPELDVLLVPGGLGTRDETNIAPAMEFIKEVFPRLKYLITVCTGSALVAKTGLLDGKRATTNKRAWSWATSQGPAVNWVPKARWVVDGNVWTSSGISAGIDATYAFVAEVYGEETAKGIADASEYTRCMDPEADPFAERWGVV